MTTPILEEVARAIRAVTNSSLCKLCDRRPSLIRCHCREEARAAAEVLLRGMFEEAHKGGLIDIRPNEPMIHAMQFVKSFAADLGIEME